jgi:hypothetical protein
MFEIERNKEREVRLTALFSYVCNTWTRKNMCALFSAENVFRKKTDHGQQSYVKHPRADTHVYKPATYSMHRVPSEAYLDLLLGGSGTQLFL